MQKGKLVEKLKALRAALEATGASTEMLALIDAQIAKVGVSAKREALGSTSAGRPSKPLPQDLQSTSQKGNTSTHDTSSHHSGVLCENCGEPTTFGANAYSARASLGWCHACFKQKQREDSLDRDAWDLFRSEFPDQSSEYNQHGIFGECFENEGQGDIE